MQALETACAGICIHTTSAAGFTADTARASAWLQQLRLLNEAMVEIAPGGPGEFPGLIMRWRSLPLPMGADLYDTTELASRLGHGCAATGDDLVREIVAAMLMGPVAFEFPSLDELQAHVRIRCNTVEAARRTALAFHTSEAERPEEHWDCDDEHGFRLKPGRPLIDALRAATQPAPGGPLYAFSCYRATEYVMLLAIAEELATTNPALLAALQQRCEHSFIRSGAFHDVFLREHGSLEMPLPPTYYVPGDRVWFRNPDEASADAAGFEGSWVFYLGGGLFSNFWEQGQPYTLPAKCLEIYHWRDGTFAGADGELQMDEQRVSVEVRASIEQGRAPHIVARMMRYRDPRGVYAEGGCIDATREYPRWICPGTADLVLPAH